MVQQEDGQYATIVQNADQFTLQQCVEDGEMTIHIEDTVTTEGVIMTEQVQHSLSFKLMESIQLFEYLNFFCVCKLHSSHSVSIV